MSKSKKPRAVDRCLSGDERRALASAFAHAYTVTLYFDMDPKLPLPEDLFADDIVADLFVKLERATSYAQVYGEVCELVRRMAARLDINHTHAARLLFKN